jgi:hypothetical protein
VLHRAPRLFGLARTRWWLDGLRQVVPWLAACSLSGVHGLLRRLRVVYKRGRRYVHSPDPDYDAKLAVIASARAAAQAAPGRIVFLYQDELTYYRHPTVAQGYAPRGRAQPLARQGYGYNRMRRIAACIDVQTGRLVAWQRAHCDVRTLVRYFHAVAAAYPDAERIYVALDNWPVHFHPDLLAALPPQITLLPLPTYAPWTNPVEKVWRWLYAEVLHLHEFTDRWPELWDVVDAWLAQWADGGPALLHYVGLCGA